MRIPAHLERSFRKINRYAVSTFINDRASEGPECIKPLYEQLQLQRLPGKRWY